MFRTQYNADFFVADHYGLRNTTSRLTWDLASGYQYRRDLGVKPIGVATKDSSTGRCGHIRKNWIRRCREKQKTVHCADTKQSYSCK
jgi:hypothetical protein